MTLNWHYFFKMQNNFNDALLNFLNLVEMIEAKAIISFVSTKIRKMNQKIYQEFCKFSLLPSKLRGLRGDFLT